MNTIQREVRAHAAMLMTSPLCMLCLVAAILLMAGCAATRVDVQWSNPEFVAQKVTGKILVVGLARDPAMRRVYEDEVVAHLAARGVSALRSYEVVTVPLGAESPAPLLAVARREGAGAILSSAVVGHEHIAHISFDEPAARWSGVYEGWYRHYWPYLYRHTDVQVTQRYLSSTTLIDVASGKIRWTVRTHTDASGNVERDIKGFAGVVIETFDAHRVK